MTTLELVGSRQISLPNVVPCIPNKLEDNHRPNPLSELNLNSRNLVLLVRIGFLTAIVGVWILTVRLSSLLPLFP